MLFAAHRVIVAIYLILPVLALAVATRQSWRRRRALPLTSLALTSAAGLAIGVAICLVYAVGTRGRLVTDQVLLAGYFATGLLLLLKGFDALLRGTLAWLTRLPNDEPVVTTGEPGSASATAGAPPPAPVPLPPRLWMRAALAGVLRAAILFAVGLPYVMASVLTYRPKVEPIDDPQSQLGYEYERVTFDATDGTSIAGWWIPAQRQRRNVPRDPMWGKRTVIACHGLAANKSNQLILARAYPPEGFNVLIFDFRAHGESGGQLTTMGDRERRDVLGAVRWVRAQHPEESEKLYGVGASLGGAALIAAAADDSDEGRAIDAIAVYGTYDHLGALTRSIAQNYFFPPLRQLLIHVGLPLASVQTGADLTHFAPAELVQRLWPRPLMIVHGRRDEIIRFDHGQSLFDAAAQPKYNLWLKDGTHNDVIDNEAAAKLVLEFFRSAEPVPVI